MFPFETGKIGASVVEDVTLEFSISHNSNKVGGWRDLNKHYSNQKKAASKDGESSDSPQALGSNHLQFCLLLLQFVWAIDASYYATKFVLGFCH